MLNEEKKLFYTGTTYECAMSILADGMIRTRPPERVWEAYSEEYVYFFSEDLIAKDYDLEGEDITIRCVEKAASQASFAVWQMNHSRRVIFAVELDETLMDEDPDCLLAQRFPSNVPLSSIQGVYVERRNNCRKIKEFIGITKLLDANEELKFTDPDDRKVLKGKYRGLEYVPSEYIFNLQQRYEELMEWEESISLFTYVPLSSFMRKLTA